MRRSMLASAAILLLAALLRLNAVTYGLSAVCLTVPEEYWLFAAEQTTSLYNWNIAPQGALTTLPGRILPRPLLSAEAQLADRLGLRLAGVVAGLVTVALMLCLGRSLGSNWWWAAGLFTAVAPWQVASDRWITPYDAAPLVLMLSVWAYGLGESTRSGWRRAALKGVSTAAALSLLLIAPPLWWLAVLMVVLPPRPHWRLILFLLLGGIVVFPALQTPELWLAAAARWDLGVTSACILVGLLLVLWWRRHLSRWYISALVVVSLCAGAVTLNQTTQLPQPTAEEWELVRWLQNRIPDDEVVQFDFTVWHLAPVVACPMGADIRFQAQSMPVEFFDVRELASPYYLISNRVDAVAKMPYISQVGEHFWIGRRLALPNVTDIGFGELVHVLGYELVTTSTTPAGTVDLRIDYQFGANITPDVLAYAAFVHVTPENDPLTNSVNISDPFFAESGNTGSRRVMLNHHIRFSLPPTIPAGVYAVRLGIFNVYTGEKVGEELILGELVVTGIN